MRYHIIPWPLLSVGISTYGNPKDLDRCIRSVHRFVHQVFVIHGPYIWFDKKYDWSWDATREVCEKYVNVIPVDFTRPLQETTKRNRYMQYAKDYHFLLVLDDDEYVVGGWKKWQKAHELFKEIENRVGWPSLVNINIYTPHLKHRNDLKPRIFYLPKYFSYNKKHYAFLNKYGKNQIELYECELGLFSIDPIWGIQIVHDPTRRKKEFEEATEDWQSKQHWYEEKIRIKV